MVPPALREYILCHHVFSGITPEALDRMDQQRIEAHYICWQQDQIAQAMKAGEWKQTREINRKGKNGESND